MNQVGPSGLDPFTKTFTATHGRGNYMTALRACEPVSIPQVFLVVIDFVLDQEFKIFFFEGSLSMMLTLVANVSDDSFFF
jgi:hypothetical protein